MASAHASDHPHGDDESILDDDVIEADDGELLTGLNLHYCIGGGGDLPCQLWLTHLAPCYNSYRSR